MSDKMTCPGCNAHTSGVLERYAEGLPCPSCGLSAAATAEILSIRKRRADADLTAKLETALRRADEAEREARELRWRLDAMRDVLGETPPDWLHRHYHEGDG